jgi:CubicO group peptidase (beta-lactamase class C family)
MAQGPDAATILADRIDRNRQGVGIAAAIVSGGKPAFFSHGVIQAGTPDRVDEATRFEIGSVTKLFTDLLLAQLVLEGKMALDEPVTRYLPDGTVLPQWEGQAITPFDLATHSAGLPPIPPDITDPLDPYKDYGADRLFGFLAQYELPRPPGEQFEYSNAGIALLGAAISHTAGQPYAELVEERILVPLGMTETSMEPDSGAFAIPHDINGAPVPAWSFDAFAPVGAYRSTAGDLAKFVAAASGQVETPLAPAFELMFSQTRPAGQPNMQIGLGWMILSHPGGEIAWHNGLTGGSNAFVGFERETGKGAVVLANQVGQTGIEDIGFHLIDPTLPLVPQVPPREAISIDPQLLPRYAGQYRLGPEFTLTVTGEDNRLFVQATGQQRLEIFAESETEFFYRAVDAQISFELDPAGEVTGLVLHQNGQDMAGEKL